MRLLVRLITAVAVTTTLISSAGTAHAEPRFAPAKTSAEYIAALQALPDAYRAIATAQANVTVAVAGISDALHILRDANLTEATAAQQVTAAEQVVEREQANMDDMARTMYMAGGAATPLDPFLAEPDSPQSLTRAMDTYTYLKGASDQQVTNYETAQAEAAQARQTRAEAQTAVLAAQAAVDLSAQNALDAQQAVKDARTEYQRLQYVTSTNPDVEYEDPGKCGDWLVRLLLEVGFEGENLREAYAIVLRESGGNAKAVSVTNDLGLFQINTKTWQGQPWFDRDLLLTKRFNAQIGYMLSDGGRNWYSWGLDGHGRVNAQAYYNSGWTDEDVQTKIVEPYLRNYALFPLDPANCVNGQSNSPVDAEPNGA